jgi:hypothetical protein
MKVSGFGHALGCVAAAMLAGCGGSQPPIVAPSTGTEQVLSHHVTFHYTGEEQTFKVPVNVKWLTVVALGAAGGGLGSRGGRAFAEFPVVHGEHLAVYVGATATGASGGYNGGGDGAIYSGYSSGGYGGGGATDIREAGTRLHDRILVAGGGGGQGGQLSYAEGYGIGGKGGGSNAGTGNSGYGSDGVEGGGGTGGTHDGGGSGGPAGFGGYGYGQVGLNGSRADGGSGGGGYRGSTGGGGGGGGYYGGGGGGWAYGDYFGGGGGGGGGSSYIEPSARKYESWQGWKTATGNGLAVFSW